MMKLLIYLSVNSFLPLKNFYLDDNEMIFVLAGIFEF